MSLTSPNHFLVLHSQALITSLFYIGREMMILYMGIVLKILFLSEVRTFYISLRSTTIFWGSFPFQHSYCQISLHLKNNLFLLSFVTLNLSYKISGLCIILQITVNLWFLFTKLSSILFMMCVLQMNTLVFNRICFISVHSVPATQNTSSSGLGHDIHVSFSWGIANWWSILSLAPYALLRKTNLTAGPFNS